MLIGSDAFHSADSTLLSSHQEDIPEGPLSHPQPQGIPQPSETDQQSHHPGPKVPQFSNSDQPGPQTTQKPGPTHGDQPSEKPSTSSTMNRPSNTTTG